MNQIRYKQRVCNDQEKIGLFLSKTRVGVVSMVDGNVPYAVPVNFVWNEGKVYFHGMGSGKKVDILSKNNPISFTVFEEYGTVSDPMPCKADTAYMSVMIFGNARKVEDFEEAATALQKILDKYMPEFYKNPMSASLMEKYRSGHDQNRTAVFCISPDELTAKENYAEPEQLFKI
ncbi:MAG: pyridoxamine 5'-phosphate oxidase family protein [Candidatus Marinarcus sp.]|uniref:pyridoxamine 5'-phosphate oxidase family protein n=1 Tax=Candidatus Marinarcus sp. TaxID=3100987 RepID=UPI003B008D74